MVEPPSADAGVLVEGGGIVAVGPRGDLEGAAERVVRLQGVLLPGLVDGWSRVEHADARLGAGVGRPAWDEAMESETATWDADRWMRSARRGVQLLLRAGVTCARDVVANGSGVPAAARAGLAGDSLVELRGVDVRHHDDALAALQRTLELPAGERRVGLAAVTYDLGTGVLQALGELAAERAVPLGITAGTCREETEALRDGAGAFARAARRRGLGYEWLSGTALTPGRYLDRLGVLRPGATVAHAVWLDQGEVGMLADRGAAVAACIRADAAHDAGAAPLQTFAEAGVAVVLGSAGHGQPDPLAEARAWRDQMRERSDDAGPPSGDGAAGLEETALRMITVEGARALGWGQRCGILAPGRRADFTLLDLDTTPADVQRDLIDAGAGRQVLTVLGGVRRARRSSGDDPWPPIDHETEEADDG